MALPEAPSSHLKNAHIWVEICYRMPHLKLYKAIKKVAVPHVHMVCKSYC